MYPSESLRLVLVLALMFAFLIMRSKLAEYRTDDISVDGGMGRSWQAFRRSLRADHYSAPGRRLLPWLRLTWAAMIVALFAFVFGPHKI